MALIINKLLKTIDAHECEKAEYAVLEYITSTRAPGRSVAFGSSESQQAASVPERDSQGRESAFPWVPPRQFARLLLSRLVYIDAGHPPVARPIYSQER